LSKDDIACIIPKPYVYDTFFYELVDETYIGSKFDKDISSKLEKASAANGKTETFYDLNENMHVLIQQYSKKNHSYYLIDYAIKNLKESEKRGYGPCVATILSINIFVGNENGENMYGAHAVAIISLYPYNPYGKNVYYVMDSHYKNFQTLDENQVIEYLKKQYGGSHGEHLVHQYPRINSSTRIYLNWDQQPNKTFSQMSQFQTK
jgi:hypothetical protein